MKRFQGIIKINQEPWVNGFERDIFKLINNSAFPKGMENVRKHRDIKLVTTRARWNYLVSEPSYHAKIFLEKFVGSRIGKTQTVMNKRVC